MIKIESLKEKISYIHVRGVLGALGFLRAAGVPPHGVPIRPGCQLCRPAELQLAIGNARANRSLLYMLQRRPFCFRLYYLKLPLM